MADDKLNVPDDTPAWASLLEAVRLVVRLQTGSADLARGMTDKWITEGCYAFEAAEVGLAYGQAVEFLRKALQTGQIKGRGQSPADDKTREIMDYEWSGYYCDFRRGGLVNEREAPKFIQLSQIESKGLIGAITGEQPSPPTDAAAKGRPGRKKIIDQETVDDLVCKLMDEHGEFMPGDPKWNAKARLEDAVRPLIKKAKGKEAADSTVKEYVQKALTKWRAHNATSAEI